MKPEQRFPLSVFLVFCMILTANGGNILVWYTDGSHWINLKPVLDTLIDRGHRATVLVPNSSLSMNSREPSQFRYEPINVSISREEREKVLEDALQFLIYEKDHMSYWEFFLKVREATQTTLEYSLKCLDGLVKSEAVMKRLREGNYDLLLADPVQPGSDLLADMLGLPLVFSLRSSLANYWERHCGQVPAPPSFVPIAMSQLTDKMSFFERVQNFFLYTAEDIVIKNILFKDLENYYSEVKGRPVTICEVMSNTAIWLIRTYWDFDYPRPFVPNFKYIGGIHCRPAEPLPKDMEEFVQSSGDAGIVVFTLGSMVKNMPKEKANIIASALAQIPQKVLWKLSGQKPENLGSNTRIYDWIPQNDLLGHPKMKAFITHGGTNGIYEAIYHGIPMVGIPLFLDQPDNMVHIKSKGAAVVLNFKTITAEDLRDAIKTVINDKSYKENTMRLSKIHHDRPLSARDEAVFWIEFTMRNKGAKHLRVSSHELTWYQYHSLDVLVFLLVIFLLSMYLFFKTCSFFCRRCCRRKVQRKTKAE